MLSEARDTIVALSTPPGVGAVSIVRLSGPRALSLAQRRLESRGASDAVLPHARARRRWLTRADGRRLDQAVVLAFHAPHSYTGEDVVEFQLHGSPWLVEELLADLRQEAAVAEPGEFTRRAVEHGRLNLSQAEGVRALVEARSGLAHNLALRSLSGDAGRRVQVLLQELLDLLSLVEAELDFAEHEIDPTPVAVLRSRAGAAIERLEAWRASWRLGRLSHGAQVVLAGEPNAGKSTLMNALLEDSRVLVDEDPGTTRDAIAQELRLGDLSVTLWDTAGLRDSESRVERQGVARTRELLETADVILLLRAPHQSGIPELTERASCLPVLTKSDLANAETDRRPGELAVSALTSAGLTELKAALHQRLVTEDLHSLDLVLTEARHVQLVDLAAQCLRRFCAALAAGLDRPLAATDLREAAEAVGAIVGGADFDDLYPLIFSRFCVGK
ncbi:MAG: tRNA uridine-5-carboxymethylaminomethyl(34) synthesis GTPase MnmE [Candidatus Delongbacteria bacterium]